MLKWKYLICALLLTSISATSALASSLITLGGAKADKTISTIGTAPVKKIKPLNLGKLRTREAQLPGGLLTLADRMKLRAKRARTRQKAVTFASRSKRHRDAKKAEKKARARPREQDEVVLNDRDEPVLQ